MIIMIYINFILIYIIYIEIIQNVYMQKYVCYLVIIDKNRFKHNILIIITQLCKNKIIPILKHNNVQCN